MKTKDRQSARAIKAERRARRRKRWSRREEMDLTRAGGTLGAELIRRTLEALGDIDPSGDWADVRPSVMPLLKRVRHPYPPDAAPMHLHVPPGVWTGFGIDLGAAWAHVSTGLFSRWAIDEATLLGTALENLRRRAIEEPPQVERATVVDTPITVIQAQGWGSALILAPERLAALLGDAPRTLLTPVRNALVALPEHVDVAFAALVWETFAEECPDELDIDPLWWDGEVVTTFGHARRDPVH